MRDLLKFVASELAADRADVVQDLLEYVATEVTDKPARSSFVKQVVASEGWQQLRQRLESRGKVRRSPSRGRR